MTTDTPDAPDTPAGPRPRPVRAPHRPRRLPAPRRSRARQRVPRRHDRSQDQGASAVEYALLATGVAMVILVAVVAFGGNVADLFGTVCFGDGC